MKKHIYDISHMSIDPLMLFKALADKTRLTVVLLIQHEHELCVCELTTALDVSQPKISRHLAQLRASGLLIDRREGQWVYYRINPELPTWALHILAEALEGDLALAQSSLNRLDQMGSRPERLTSCC